MSDRLTPEEVIIVKASVAAQERVRELIERNNAGLLSPEEEVEVERIMQFERMYIVLKSRALKSLNKK